MNTEEIVIVIDNILDNLRSDGTLDQLKFSIETTRSILTDLANALSRPYEENLVFKYQEIDGIGDFISEVMKHHNHVHAKSFTEEMALVGVCFDCSIVISNKNWQLYKLSKQRVRKGDKK